MLLLLSVLLLGPPPARAGPALPSQTCREAGQACEAHQDNLVLDQPEVETVEECIQLCRDTAECNMVSHFGPTSSPLHRAGK